jgi:hypothetical protein
MNHCPLVLKKLVVKPRFYWANARDAVGNFPRGLGGRTACRLTTGDTAD